MRRAGNCGGGESFWKLDRTSSSSMRSGEASRRRGSRPVSNRTSPSPLQKSVAAASDSVGNPFFQGFFFCYLFCCVSFRGGFPGMRVGFWRDKASRSSTELPSRSDESERAVGGAALSLSLSAPNSAVSGVCRFVRIFFACFGGTARIPIQTWRRCFFRAASRFWGCLSVILGCCCDQITGGKYPVLLGYQSWYGDAIARLLRTWNLEALGSDRNSVAYSFGFYLLPKFCWSIC